MNFKHDLLLVDLETTGLDSSCHEIIQIAALLLDRRTLKKKKSFNNFIRPTEWKSRDRESMKVNKIIWEQIKDAPDLKSAIKKFNKEFSPKKVVLSYYGGPLDMDFLRVAYKKSAVKWQFDYHYFNLWAVFYGSMAAKNQLKSKTKHAGFTLDSLAKKLKVKISGSRHDAFYDCRLEAEVLRKIIKKIK